MENENTENNKPAQANPAEASDPTQTNNEKSIPGETPPAANNQESISGEKSLTDPYLVARAAAKVKAGTKGKLKSRHTVLVTETVKVATAFGATNKEITVEKEVEKTPELTPEEKQAAADSVLEKQLREELAKAGNTNPTEEQLKTAKELRQKLSGLWSTDINKTSAADDRYIEGLPHDGNTAVVNPDAGADGVRISFKSKSPKTK